VERTVETRRLPRTENPLPDAISPREALHRDEMGRIAAGARILAVLSLFGLCLLPLLRGDARAEWLMAIAMVVLGLSNLWMWWAARRAERY
jgi:hypothetical protein